jgi:hypothetical protein
MRSCRTESIRRVLCVSLNGAKSIVGEDAESNNTAHTRALVAMSLVIAAIMAKE